MQKKTLTLLASCLCGGFVASVADGATEKVPENFVGVAELAVDPSAELRPIKVMNAGNNAPLDAVRHAAWNEFKALKVPYARTHDIETHYSYGEARLCAISALFPNFDADETDPKNYDFTNTDHLLKKWHDAGTQIFFRFGEHSEDQPRKHFVLPPKDNAKWARICEHVIRHYNEGWADGFRWGIRYWEIWNEPDIATDFEPNHTMWLGTRQQFFDLFKTTVKYLTAKFPDLKIGGPALCWDRSFGHDLMKQCRDEGIRPGFFSWHSYGTTPEFLKDKARYYRGMLDELGFTDVESIDDEWNYNAGWGQAFHRSLRTMPSLKGASFAMSMMIVGQDEPVDMMMYYDFRDASTFNGVFDRLTYKPTKAYWPFVAWRRLAEAGTQVKATLAGETNGVYAVAAKGAKGNLVVAVCRHTDDDNEFRKRRVKLAVKGRPIPDGTAVKLVDPWFAYGEAFFPVTDGALELTLEPNAFAVLELPCRGEDGSTAVRLAEDGCSLADIVIAEKASVAAQFGARDLQWHLKQMTGADFRIIRDTEPQTRYEIRVGESSRTRHRADEFKKQRFLVDVGETATELIGWDGVQKGYREVTLEFPENAAPKGKNWPTVYTRQGSMYAVYEFLERWCGVRWANFTRYGTLLPQRPALTVKRGSYAGEPFMFYRGGTMDTVWGEDTSPMWFYTPQCSNYVNWCAAAFPGGVKDAGTYDRLWLLRNRAGGELQPACHSFGWLYEKYWDEGSRVFVEKRPQYFAKGYPNRPPQPCFSNPELIKTVVADARAYFDRGGGRWGENAYCLEPEDGSSFCQCADCTRQFELARSKDSSQHSTYWFRFVNAVAREVKKTHPDKLVTTLAYATHQGVPTGFDVEDNVCIYSCLYHNRERPGNPLYRGEIARMREWHDRQPQVKLAVWLYNCFPLLSGSWGKYNTFPGFFAHEAVRQYRELHELGARGGVFHCGFNGEVANYMQLKLMIDPQRDVEDLLKEHFSIYGKAAPAMREFYDLVEERYADESYYPKKGGGGQFLSWGCLGTKDLMDRLADCMKRAEAAAETESEKALVNLFRLDVWDYMRAGYATYQSRASTPLPSWTAKRIAAGADGDPDKVDWTKASSVTTQFYKSGCAEKVPSEVTVRLAHDGKWLYLELGERTDVKKLVVAAAVCPCDTWEVLLARQCGVPYRYYIAGPDARGLAYCHGEEGVRNGAPAEELGPKFFGAKCRTDRTQKDRWTTRFAFPLDRMTEKPVQPGETVYMNAVRVMNSSLSPSGGMAVYSLVSHSYVHVPDRLGEITLEK